MFDFPDTPTEGQVFSPPGGPRYTYNAPVWNAVPGTGPITWDEIEEKPATFPPTLPITQADVTNLVADLGAKAPINSPVFTGTPQALTAAPGTNTVQLATTEFVTSAMAAGFAWTAITGKPATFPPTLPIAQSGVINLTADLAGKAGVVHTHAQIEIINLSTDLAAKAPLTSPNFVGFPQADTPSAGANNRQIATTAFVQGTLSLQIAGREPAITAGTTTQYWRGDKTWQTIAFTAYGTLYGYLFNTSTTTPPAAGGIRFNNATQSAVTAAYISYVTEDGVDLKTYFTQRIKQGDTIYIQDRDDVSKWQLYEVNTAFTDSGTYATIPVTWKAGGSALTAQRVVVSRESAGVAGGGVVGEAPNDGALYARQSLGWASITATLAGKAPIASPTFTGKVTTATSGALGAGFTLPPGAQPTTPVNGDVWLTAASLEYYTSGVVHTVAALQRANTFTAANQFNNTTIFRTSDTGGASLRMPHGTAPTSPTNGDMWTTTAGVLARINGATVGPFMSGASPTFTGKATTAASASGGAGFNLPHGAAPTSPVNGDVWTTTAGVFARLNGATVQVSPGWVEVTQAAYDAIGTKDPNLLYVIVG